MKAFRFKKPITVAEFLDMLPPEITSKFLFEQFREGKEVR